MVQKLLREEIAERIRGRGWQQKDFAERCDLSAATISRTLSGDMVISKEIAEIYANVLDLDVEETVRRAFVESTCKEFTKRYQNYPTVLKLLRAVEDFSTLPIIYEE